MKNVFFVLLLLFVVINVYAEVNVFNDPVVLEEGELIREGDFNKDGNADHWMYSLRGGAVHKVVRDLDFDGNIDAVQWTFLRNKKVGQFEKILYFDLENNVVDSISYFDENNKVVRIEKNSR